MNINDLAILEERCRSHASQALLLRGELHWTEVRLAKIYEDVREKCEQLLRPRDVGEATRSQYGVSQRDYAMAASRGIWRSRTPEISSAQRDIARLHHMLQVAEEEAKSSRLAWDAARIEVANAIALIAPLEPEARTAFTRLILLILTSSAYVEFFEPTYEQLRLDYHARLRQAADDRTRLGLYAEFRRECALAAVRSCVLMFGDMGRSATVQASWLAGGVALWEIVRRLISVFLG